MRRGIYNLLAYIAVILGMLEIAAVVLFLLANALLIPFPTLSPTTYSQAFVLTLLGALVVVAWRLIFGRVP